MRREGFRRPELLPPNAHSIDQSVIGDSMGMHDMGHGLEDVQVGAFFFFNITKMHRGRTDLNMHNFLFIYLLIFIFFARQLNFL